MPRANFGCSNSQEEFQSVRAPWGLTWSMEFFMRPPIIPFKLAALMEQTLHHMTMECIELFWHPLLASVCMLSLSSMSNISHFMPWSIEYGSCVFTILTIDRETCLLDLCWYGQGNSVRKSSQLNQDLSWNQLWVEICSQMIHLVIPKQREILTAPSLLAAFHLKLMRRPFLKYVP